MEAGSASQVAAQAGSDAFSVVLGDNNAIRAADADSSGIVVAILLVAFI
jgi:hypothetical protein